MINYDKTLLKIRAFYMHKAQIHKKNGNINSSIANFDTLKMSTILRHCRNAVLHDEVRFTSARCFHRYTLASSSINSTNLVLTNSLITLYPDITFKIEDVFSPRFLAMCSARTALLKPLAPMPTETPAMERRRSSFRIPSIVSDRPGLTA